MKISKLSALSLAMLMIGGCSSMGIENKRVDYKAAAAKVPTLDIPPDLTAPTIEDHYTIPDSSTSVASYSDFSKGGGAAPSHSSVLPESRKVHMEHNGAQRWLVVNDKAENLWPVIKAFWQENGLVVKLENPQAGIMETDWAENRAKIPKTGLRSILGKVMDGLYDSGELDMYHVRLERSKDGNSTDIYLTQYGKEEMLSADKSLSKWQSRPNDPELEATMLQMLMVKLGGAEAQASVQTGQVDTSAVQGNVAPPRLQALANGSKMIVLGDPFDRSWRNVGLALEQGGFVVEDKDRANGVYFLRLAELAKQKSWLDKMAFWRDDENTKPVRYQVTVHETNAGCEVSANDGNGSTNANTTRIIDTLYKTLAK